MRAIFVIAIAMFLFGAAQLMVYVWGVGVCWWEWKDIGLFRTEYMNGFCPIAPEVYIRTLTSAVIMIIAVYLLLTHKKLPR